MNESGDYHLNYTYDININFTEQRQILEKLNNKYKLKDTKKPSTASTRTTTNNNRQNSGANSTDQANSSSSRQDSNSNSIGQTNSKDQKNVKDIKTKRNDKKPAKNTISKNKFENACVVIDFELLKAYGEGILNELEVLEIKHECKTQIYSNLITWYYENDESNPEEKTEFQTALLMLNWKEVVEYISSNSLLKHIKSISDVLMNKRITLGLYGFENYFKYWKLSKQGKGKDKKFDDYRNSVKISRYELEYVLTELELKFSYCHRFLENTQDIVNIISQYTKSIAQLPEKLEKNEKYKNLDFCLAKDTRDCVLVDKNGNGFRRLWQQQLTTFDLVRLETAEAILSKYATPAQLFQAYANCTSKVEATKLLEDIPIRRAVGPLTTARKIGPELSNKVYNFFNATDNNSII